MVTCKKRIIKLILVQDTQINSFELPRCMYSRHCELVGRLVGWLVGWSVCQNILKGRNATLSSLLSKHTCYVTFESVPEENINVFITIRTYISVQYSYG